MAKTLFICGSPRKGNTEFVLKTIFDQVKGDKEFIALKGLNIHACIGCRHCKKTNSCAIKDDIQPIVDSLLTADIIVFGSPNYFAGISGIAKNLIDRTLPFYHKSLLRNKKIFLVSTGHSKDSTNKKYITQGTYGFVKYHKMKLIQAYGLYSEDETRFKTAPATTKKLDKIVKDINTMIK